MKMSGSLAVLVIALVAVAFGAHDAFATPPSSVCAVLNICPSPSHPAPAPLLAAGIPAFTALGGGVLVARLRKRFLARK